jgi:geranylgeranyl diphosphate synthase type I
MQQVVAAAKNDGLDELHHMMAYHLGWEGEGAGARAQGKRIRPQMVLLASAAAGGDWRQALPAAASVELLHNFSLIHDDIQDNSPLRRGRPTVWSLWGIPQAINAGDSMFALAHVSMLKLGASLPEHIVLEAYGVLTAASLTLTQGQYLDLSYEQRGDLTLEAYWPMISGKTASLLAACAELGALAAGAGHETRAAYRSFGEKLGLAFQARDDLLGIWGEAQETGKSAESDLLSGKKSLPVLFALEKKGGFAARWNNGEVPELAAQLEAEGARDYARDMVAQLTRSALAALEQTGPLPEPGEALTELANMLLSRTG